MFRPIAIASAASGPGPNEDAAGTAGDGRIGAAWVIDGATDVGGRTFVPGTDSDAAWYARTLDAGIASLSPGDPAAIARGAIVRAAEAWSTAVAGMDVPRHGLPSAAVAWVGWTVVLRQDGHPARALGRQGVTASEVALNAAVRRLQQEGVADSAARRAALIDRLQSQRARMNSPGGYWIFSVDPAAADHLDRMDVRLDGAGHLLLATDGFWRLVDPYGVHDADGLMDAVVARGPQALIAELRALEAADADCIRFPRIKARDDATAVLIRYG
jgi:serine/threonine protein phosphatase PrpC